MKEQTEKYTKDMQLQYETWIYIPESDYLGS